MRAPVAVAMRPASARPSARTARSVSMSMAGSPERRILAQRAITSSLTRVRAIAGATAATPSASFHAVSAGKMSVAIWPGGVRAAAMAAAPSAAMARAFGEVRTHAETGRAMPSMSEVRGASCLMWYVACSPTMLTIPELALRALCRFARPLPRPGPRCSSVAAGRSAMRQ